MCVGNNVHSLTTGRHVSEDPGYNRESYRECRIYEMPFHIKIRLSKFSQDSPIDLF